MKFTELFEQEGETLATTLERGKNKLNDWYAGFYAGFHGQAKAEDESNDWKRGYSRGKATSAQKTNC